MIDDERKFIFVENSKTGTYSIKKALMGENLHNPLDPRMPTVNHFTPAKIKNLYPAKWRDYTTFVFVRNTWDRAHSFFEFYRDINGANSYKDTTFDEWIAQGCPPPNEDHLRAIMHGEGRFDDVLDQLRYVEDVNEIIVLHSFNRGDRNAELQVGLNRIISVLGIDPLQAPHVNDHGRSERPFMWKQETIDRLHKRYAKEIERFGFRPPQMG